MLKVNVKKLDLRNIYSRVNSISKGPSYKEADNSKSNMTTPRGTMFNLGDRSVGVSPKGAGLFMPTHLLSKKVSQMNSDGIVCDESGIAEEDEQLDETHQLILGAVSTVETSTQTTGMVKVIMTSMRDELANPGEAQSRRRGIFGCCC